MVNLGSHGRGERDCTGVSEPVPHPPVVILESQHQKEVEDFLARDPTSATTFAKQWKAAAPLNYARSYSMVAVLTPRGTEDEVVVAAGGMSLIPMFDPMASVEVYSPKDDKWTLFDDGQPGALPNPTGFGSGARINATHMLAAGGVGSGNLGTQARVFSLSP